MIELTRIAPLSYPSPIFLAGGELRISSEARAVSELSLIVDDILASTFAPGRPHDPAIDCVVKAVQTLRGRLSVYPEKADPLITPDFLKACCFVASGEMGVALAERGIPVEMVESLVEIDPFEPPWEQDPSHGHLACHYNGHDLRIDLTLGQFIGGDHPYAFVGTAQELQTALFSRPRILNHPRLRDNPEKAFEKIWGNHAIRTPFKTEEYLDGLINDRW